MMNVPPDRSWTTVFFMQPFCSTNSGSITGESCKSCVFVLARVFWDECSHTLRHTPGPDMLHYCVTIWEMVQGRAAAGRQWRGECVCVWLMAVCVSVSWNRILQSRDGERERGFSQRAHAWHYCKHSHICSVSISALSLLPLDSLFSSCLLSLVVDWYWWFIC